MKELDTITEGDVLEDLGLTLGIKKSAIDAILQKKSTVKQQRKEIVYYWLQRKEIVRQKKDDVASWSQLADALDKVSYSELRKTIQKKYCQN